MEIFLDNYFAVVGFGGGREGVVGHAVTFCTTEFPSS
jgi:hypothetical protein